jgi:hypothetical protein
MYPFRVSGTVTLDDPITIDAVDSTGATQTYCSISTIDPSPNTPYITFTSSRTPVWLQQPTLRLATATGHCPLSAAAPLCTDSPTPGQPVDAVTGYSFSRLAALSGSSVYAAALPAAPAAVRILLAASAPVDALVVDELQFQRYATGLDFDFLPLFSRLGVSAVDEVLLLTGIAGDHFLLVVPARGTAGQLTRETDTHTHTHTHTHTPGPQAASVLSVSLAVAGAAVDSALVPSDPAAAATEAYFSDPSPMVRVPTHTRSYHMLTYLYIQP